MLAESPVDDGSVLHPFRRLLEKVRDAGLRESVLLKIGDNLGLIQGGERAGWSVGQEDQPLVVLRSSFCFNDDRDLSVALLSPGSEPLESIQHFVVTTDRNHTDRQRRQVGLRFRSARTELCVARLEFFERQNVEVWWATFAFPIHGVASRSTGDARLHFDAA